MPNINEKNKNGHTYSNKMDDHADVNGYQLNQDGNGFSTA